MIETYGRYLRIGDVLHGDERTVTGFRHDPNEADRAAGWFYVEFDDDYSSVPYKNDEDVALTRRGPEQGMTYAQWCNGGNSPEIADLMAFRDMVREIVHARPNESDEDVLVLLKQDHETRADSIGCVGCD